MGKLLRPFLVDQKSYDVFMQFMDRTVGFFNNAEGLGYVNQEVDADYVKWVNTFEKDEPGNVKILEELSKFLHDASEKPGISQKESESIHDLTNMLKAATDLRKLIASDLGDQSIQQRMLEIGNLVRVLGGEDSSTGQKKPSFEDILRNFNKATGFQYVKTNEFKALSVLKDQVNKAVISYEQVAILHINNKADEYVEKQHECVEHVMSYNALANDYLEYMDKLDIRSNTMEGNIKITEDKIAELQAKHAELEKDYKEKVAADNKLQEKIEEEKGNLAFFTSQKATLTEQVEEAQKKHDKLAGESKIAGEKSEVANDVLKTAEANLTAAEGELKRCAEDVEAAKDRMPSEEEIKEYLDSIGSQMDELAAKQQTYIEAIGENDNKIKNLQGELKAEQSRYIKQLDDISVKLGDEAANVSPEDEERYKELQETLKKLQNTINKSSLMNGFIGLSLGDTNALIEGLRINDKPTKKEDLSDMNPKKLQQADKVKGYYALLKTYRDLYNTVHKGEKTVGISGKMSFSRPRNCSVGTKAAIDFLNSTIKNEETGEMGSISDTLRRTFLNLQKEINTLQEDKKEVANAIKLRAEKEKLENELKQVEERIKNEIGKVTENNEDKKEKITGLASAIATERTKEAELSEAKRQEATKKLKEIAVVAAEEKVQKAKTKVENAKLRVDDAREEANELSLKAESAKAAAEEAKNKLESAKNNKKDMEKTVDDRTKKIQDYEAQKVISDRERSLACSKSEGVQDDIIHYQEGLKQQKNFMKDLNEKRATCNNELEELDLERSNVGQIDNRYQSILKQISAYCEDVEDGNEKKSDGTWKHKNGSHYKALKEGLLTFETALKKGDVTDMKGELEKLQALADGYLEARSHDFGARLTGGSQFRHNRLNFVTGIRNFCQNMAFPSSLKPTSVNNTDKTYLMRKDELLLEPNVSNQSIIQSNMQVVEEDNFTVIDDSISKYTKFTKPENMDINRFAEEQNLQLEKGTEYESNLLEAGLSTWSEQQDEFVDNNMNRQDENISERELNEPVLGEDDNGSMSMNLG